MITSERKAELLKAAIRFYGEPAQIDMAIEEMSELTKALCKVKRARDTAGITETSSNVVEEIADVQIMLDQLRIIFGRDAAAEEEAKLERLTDRLRKATAGRSCENCGNPRCSNSLVAFYWDECVDSMFTQHWTPKKNGDGGWWLRSVKPGIPFMEGRAWHGEASKQGAELRAKMRPGKVYLYQLYTDIFVEFPDMATADAFRAAMSKSSPGWDIDPVAVIDTSDPAQAKNWAANMEEGGESHG